MRLGNGAIGSNGKLRINKRASSSSQRDVVLGYNNSFDFCIMDAGNKEQFKLAHEAPANSLVIKSTGDTYIYNKLGVGGITAPAQSLHVNGQILATNKITAHYSDERLKTDIEPISNPLNIIEQLNGFYYKPNKLAESFGMETNKKELGLSAQEVNKVLPELVDLAPFDTIRDENDNIVSKSGENYLTISYERMMPVIVESIKKLNNEIKLLKEENKDLKEFIKKNS